jgi:hypothetical protein
VGTGTKLSNIVDYPTIPILSQVLTAIFCYCSYSWAVHIIIGIFPLYICYWFRVIRFPSFWGARAIFSVTTVMLKDQETVDQESSEPNKVMITGHGTLRTYYHRFKIKDNPECVCSMGPQTSNIPNLGMSSSAETKRDTQVQDKEGRRKLALTQLRPCQQIHKLVPNVC